MSRRLHAGAPDVRLQLREALSSLGQKELQAQGVWTAEHLLQHLEPHQLDGCVKDIWAGLKDCTPTVRRLRYKLAALALKVHSTLHWGQLLLFVRDRAAERVGHEDNPATAAELAGMMGALAEAWIEAYCRGHLSSLGVAAKEELPREWLCGLLITPLLRAAGRGPAKTNLSNAGVMVEGVLAAFKKWASSAAVLHAAVECLREVLKLAGTVSLCAGEAFLPVQSCIRLLGPRLKAAAVAGILRMAVAGMERREEWQVRKAATDTVALLANSLLQHRQQQQQQRGASTEAGGKTLAPDSGLGALVQALPQLLAAVEQHVKYDRVSQVRQAAAALVQELQHLTPHPARQSEAAAAAPQHPPHPPSLCPSLAASPVRQAGSPSRSVRPPPPPQRSSLDFGVQVFAPAPLPQQQVQAQLEWQSLVQQQRRQAVQEPVQQYEEAALAVVALPSTASQLETFPPAQPPGRQPAAELEHQQQPPGPSSGRVSPTQATVHHVVHPLFTLRLQEAPLAVGVQAAAATGGMQSGEEPGSLPAAPLLASVDVWLEDAGHPSGPRLQVEVGLLPSRSSAGTMLRYTLHQGHLQQHPASFSRPPSSAAQPPPAPQLPALAALAANSTGVSMPRTTAQYPTAAAAAAGGAQEGSSSRPGSPARLARLADASLPSFSPQRPPAGTSSAEIGMDVPARRWAETLRPLDMAAPLLQQPDDGQPGSGAAAEEETGDSRSLGSGQRRSSSPGSPGPRPPRPRLEQCPDVLLQGSVQLSPGPQLHSQPESPWLPLAGLAGGGSSGRAWGQSCTPVEQRLHTVTAIPETAGSALSVSGKAAGQQCGPGGGSTRNDNQGQHRRQQQQQQEEVGEEATPPRPPAASPLLTSPLCCESPPYTPAMQQGHRAGDPGPGSAHQPGKGPLTVAVTKALSRLQQLQELQDWQETVSAGEYPGGTGSSSPGSPGSGETPEAEVVQGQQASSMAQGGSRDAAHQQGQHPQRGGAGGGAGGPGERGGTHHLRRSLEPTLSAIPEATEPSRSTAARDGDAGQGSPSVGHGQPEWDSPEEDSGEEDGELAQLQALQLKLEASMREVRKRMMEAQAGAGGPDRKVPLEEGAGDMEGEEGGDSIPAAWPARDRSQTERQGARVVPGPRPGSGASTASSEQYGGDGEGGEDGWRRWQNVANPLFNALRPSTALSTSQATEQPSSPTRAEQQQQGPEQHGQEAGGRGSGQAATGARAAAVHQRYHSALPALESLQQFSLEDSPSLSGWSGGEGAGGALSMRSLSSEFGRLGRETEEEVAMFLRGSIAGPAQHGAPPQRHQQLSPPSTAVPAAAAAAAAAGHDAVRGSRDAVRASRDGNLRTSINGGRADRPPLPPSAPRPSSAGRTGSTAQASQLDPGALPTRMQRQRWSHLDGPAASDTQQQPNHHHHHPQQQEQQQHWPVAGSPVRSPPRASANMRGSIDLDAILGSCTSSPSSSWAVTDAAADDHCRDGGISPHSLQRHTGGGTAEEGSDDTGFAAALPVSANLHRLQVTSWPCSPGADSEEGVRSSIEEAVRSSISQVLNATFPDDAIERLDRLRARLSPTRQR